MGRRSELIIEDLEDIMYLLEMDGFSRVCDTIKEAVDEIKSSKLEVQRYKDLLSSKGLDLQS